MRKLVHAIYVSLDGVVDEPAWTGPFFNDELAALQHQLLFASDALVLGRVTYEGFAAAWPTMTDEGDFAVRMNTMPKYVASRTLTTTAWNAELLPDDPIAAVAALKQAPGGDLLLYGSPPSPTRSPRQVQSTSTASCCSQRSSVRARGSSRTCRTLRSVSRASSRRARAWPFSPTFDQTRADRPWQPSNCHR